MIKKGWKLNENNEKYVFVTITTRNHLLNAFAVLYFSTYFFIAK